MHCKVKVVDYLNPSTAPVRITSFNDNLSRIFGGRTASQLEAIVSEKQKAHNLSDVAVQQWIRRAMESTFLGTTLLVSILSIVLVYECNAKHTPTYTPPKKPRFNEEERERRN